MIYDIIDIALEKHIYNKETDKVVVRIINYEYNDIRRTIKIKENITPDKINVLNRLLKKTNNEDVNIIVGNPEL